MRRDWRRTASARALPSSSAATLSRPSRSARVRIATSASFCLANASHPLSSASSRFSRSRSIGTWSSEHDGATHSCAAPARSRASSNWRRAALRSAFQMLDRKSTRLNSSHGYISYAVFCLKKKKQTEHIQCLDLDHQADRVLPENNVQQTD